MRGPVARMLELRDAPTLCVLITKKSRDNPGTNSPIMQKMNNLLSQKALRGVMVKAQTVSAISWKPVAMTVPN